MYILRFPSENYVKLGYKTKKQTCFLVCTLQIIIALRYTSQEVVLSAQQWKKLLSWIVLYSSGSKCETQSFLKHKYKHNLENNLELENLSFGSIIVLFLSACLVQVTAWNEMEYEEECE